MQVETKSDLACRMFAVEKALHIAQIAGSSASSEDILKDAAKIFAFVQTEPEKKSSIIAVHGRVGS